MTSLSVPHPPARQGLQSLGANEGSGFPVVASLDPFLYQRMRWCIRCGGEQIFVEVFECESARLGYCMGCGKEGVIPWTRTMEVAA